MYHQADTASAAAALRAGAEDNTGRAWVYCPDVVREYADHLESGDLQPYIPKNFVKAAALYEKSWRDEHKLKVGALYYKAHLYNDARKIFEEYPNHKVSNGYIGMMYLYGQGGFEQDFKEAYRNILSAPNELPFLVHKGDLVLYLKKDNGPYASFSYKNITDIELIRLANQYYGMAVDAAPDVEEYRIRKEVTDAVIAAYEKAPKGESTWRNSRLYHHSRYWTTYYFNNLDGAYYGVVSKLGETPNGWGVFSWNSDNSFQMTEYSGLKETNSPGIYINSDYTVGVGKIDKFRHLSEGVVTSPDGVKTVVNSR